MTTVKSIWLSLSLSFSLLWYWSTYWARLTSGNEHNDNNDDDDHNCHSDNNDENWCRRLIVFVRCSCKTQVSVTLGSVPFCRSDTASLSQLLSPFFSLSLSPPPSLPFCVFCLVPQSICLSVCPSVYWFQNASSMNESLKLLMFSARGAAVVSSDVITSCVVVGVVLGAGKNENNSSPWGENNTNTEETNYAHTSTTLCE